MEHRKWMVRNYSLTLAAVSMRIYLPFSMVLGIADLDQEDGSFHGPEIDVYHGFDRVDLSQRAAQAGFADIQFQTIFSIAKEHETGTLDYPVFLMTSRRASA